MKNQIEEKAFKAEKSIYERIKRQNGERFAKTIRNYDNGVFDVPNIVNIVKYAGNKAEPILPYLISLKKIKIEDTENLEDPLVLLDKAGYNAYYVHTLEEQNAISKYFEPNESLCTFRDPTRFQKYHIINAVKKDVDKIKREDFREKEKREDAYGTSVISIQILKDGGFISIKNRYNHTVFNPDNTFNSNPDNIIQGLSIALKQHFCVDFSARKVSLPKHFICMKNQIIRYNFEENNIYFGENFYAKDGRVYPVESHEIMMDSCILNLRDRTIRDLCETSVCFKIDEVDENTGGFVSVIANEFKGKKLQITKNKVTQTQEVWADDVCYVKTYHGQIVNLYLPTTTKIGNGFLYSNNTLAIFTAPKLETIGNGFLRYNEILINFFAPKLKIVGNDFLWVNETLTSLSAPELKSVGHSFLSNNKILASFTAPKLEYVESRFLYKNKSLTSLIVPELKVVEDNFLYCNEILTSFVAPEFKKAGEYFLMNDKTLATLHVKKLDPKDKRRLYIQNPHLKIIRSTLENKENLRSENSNTESVENNTRLTVQVKVVAEPINQKDEQKIPFSFIQKALSNPGRE